MERHQIVRGTGSWEVLSDELVVDRLEVKDPLGWMRVMRRRSLEQQRVGVTGSAQPDGEEAAGEPAGEDGSAECRQEMRRRNLEQPRVGATGSVQPDGEEAAGKPVGEDGSGEGRRVPCPTLPYVPTEKEL